MAPHSSTLAWKIPWMEEPGRLHLFHGVTKSRTWLSDLEFSFCNENLVISGAKVELQILLLSFHHMATAKGEKEKWNLGA